MVGHSDVDRVDPIPFFLEELAPVGIHARVGNDLRSLGEVVGIYVAQGHDLHARMLQEVVQVRLAHAPNPDASVVQLVVSQDGSRPGLRGATRQHERRGETSHGGRP